MCVCTRVYCSHMKLRLTTWTYCFQFMNKGNAYYYNVSIYILWKKPQWSLVGLRSATSCTKIKCTSTKSMFPDIIHTRVKLQENRHRQKSQQHGYLNTAKNELKTLVVATFWRCKSIHWAKCPLNLHISLITFNID